MEFAEDWKHPVTITPLLLSLFPTKFMTIKMVLAMRMTMKMTNTHTKWRLNKDPKKSNSYL